MRRSGCLLLILILFGNICLRGQEFSDAPSLPFSCTSFAVYTQNPLYGMNFDFSNVELRFTIRPSDDRKIFRLDARYNGRFISICGMNSDGFFANLQMLFPEGELKGSAGDDQIFTWQIFSESLNRFSTVREVEKYMTNKRIIHGGMTLHNLFADKGGHAIILEAGEQENEVTRIENKFIVMTNFPVADFRGKEYKEVEGSGADRYKKAYEYIRMNFKTFDINKSMKTLEKTYMKNDNFSTQCSMVFDPIASCVYIVLRGEYGKIWKLSIKDETLETHSGFSKKKKIKIDDTGILSSDFTGFLPSAE